MAKDPVNQRGEAVGSGVGPAGGRRVSRTPGRAGAPAEEDEGPCPCLLPATLPQSSPTASAVPPACHILECPEGLAQDVISTIGQAFELRFKQYLRNPPKLVTPHDR